MQKAFGIAIPQEVDGIAGPGICLDCGIWAPIRYYCDCGVCSIDDAYCEECGA